jgi:hypothetical protein
LVISYLVVSINYVNIYCGADDITIGANGITTSRIVMLTTPHLKEIRTTST